MKPKNFIAATEQPRGSDDIVGPSKILDLKKPDADMQKNNMLPGFDLQGQPPPGFMPNRPNMPPPGGVRGEFVLARTLLISECHLLNLRMKPWDAQVTIHHHPKSPHDATDA